jgi:ParB family chromosome partitioning protein
MSSTQSTQSAQSKSRESRAVQQFRVLGVAEIEPTQIGRRLDETALTALADSVRECGVRQPVLVRPRTEGGYRLIAGERRLRAARIAGIERIPALVCRYGDDAGLEVALIENMKNDDLSRVENARVCGTLVNELGLTYLQIAKRIGRSKAGVANLVSLLDLSQEILESMERGELGMNHGLALLDVGDPEVRGELARKAAKKQWASKKGWSVATLAAHIRASNEGAALAGDESVSLAMCRGKEQYQDETSHAVAKAWGDVLGAEVKVRLNARGQIRLEVDFTSPGAALDAAGRLDQEVSR